MDRQIKATGAHEAPEPVGLYQPYIRSGRLIALSAISSARNGKLITGKVGRDLDLRSAREAAAFAAENLMAVLQECLGGGLSLVEQVLFVRGYVNAAEDFPSVHMVIDAASELIIERLGNKGRHARTALGCATLPNSNAVTIDAVVVINAEPGPTEAALIGLG
jgi:enamine deaminase RidA (YjgF/YER057c/UK114 family)